MKKIDRLKKDIKKTLENETCRVQALDVQADRTRVLNQLIIMFTNQYLYAPKEIKKEIKKEKLSSNNRTNRNIHNRSKRI